MFDNYKLLTILFISVLYNYKCFAEYKNFAHAISSINRLNCTNKRFNKILNNKKYTRIFINRLINKYKHEHIDFIITSTLLNSTTSLELLHHYLKDNCPAKIKARHYLLVSFKNNHEIFGNRLLSALLGHKTSSNKIVIPKKINCLSCKSKKHLVKALDYSASLASAIKNIRDLYKNDIDLKNLLEKEEFIEYIIKNLNNHFNKSKNLKIIIALLLDFNSSKTWLKKYIAESECNYIKAKKYLIRSILYNKTNIACRLFKAGVLLNLNVDKKFVTAYFFNNILNPNFNMLTLLLNNGFKINNTLNKDNALTWLLKNKIENYEALKFLIKHNININHINKENRTGIDYALEIENPKIIRLLSIYGANVNKQQQNLIFENAIRYKNEDLFSLFDGTIYNNSLYLKNSESFDDSQNAFNFL